MKKFILRLLVKFKTFSRGILESQSFLIVKRSILTYLSGNSTMNNSFDMLQVGVEPIVMWTYLFIMFTVILQIIIPAGFKCEHQASFRWLRIINIAIVIILATVDCLVDGYFKPENAILVLVVIGVELLHPVLLPH